MRLSLGIVRELESRDASGFEYHMTFSAVLAWLLGGIFLTGCFAVGYFVLATRKIAAAAERAVPPAGTFIDIDGDRIHYVETGEGRPILFLHGLGGQLHHFRHPLFHRFGHGYRLIAVDRPGSGAKLPGEAIVHAAESPGLGVVEIEIRSEAPDRERH